MKIRYIKIIILTILIFLLSLTFYYLINIFKYNNHDNNNNNNNNNVNIKIGNNINNNEKKPESNYLYEKYKEKKLLVLTFDDGPSKYTNNLVNILKEKNVKATFFVMGQNLEKNKNILNKIIQNGNEIGIHCYSHKLFTSLTDTQIQEQIEKTSTLIYDECSFYPKLIRVPYGSVNNKVKDIIRNSGLTLVLWNVDSLDWKFKNTDKTYKYVLKRVTGNDIILMHDTFKTSVKAAEKIIDYYLERDYEFITVSEFIKIKYYAKSIEI